ALGVCRAFLEAGLGVPEDLSVVGFDDLPEAAFYTPPLTTVRQDLAEVGRRAAELVVRALRGEREPRAAVVEPVLVRRGSSRARGLPGVPRGGPRCPGGPERRGLRRPSRGGVLHAAAHDRPPGPRRGRQARRRARRAGAARRA